MEKYSSVGSNPKYAASCPICLDTGVDIKPATANDLMNHLERKHTKLNLASFLSHEAAFKRFWDE